MQIYPAFDAATNFHNAGSSRLAATSLTMLAPAPRAASTTSGFIVSIESGMRNCAANSRSTGSTRLLSSAASTGVARGLVDSPPMSRISAPCRANSSPCFTAASALKKRPPSEKESGGTFTTPIKRVFPGKLNLNSPARRIMLCSVFRSECLRALLSRSCQFARGVHQLSRDSRDNLVRHADQWVGGLAEHMALIVHVIDNHELP